VRLLQGYPVTMNPEKVRDNAGPLSLAPLGATALKPPGPPSRPQPRRGYFEVRVGDKAVFSAGPMPRPFTKLREASIAGVASSVLAAVAGGEPTPAAAAPPAPAAAVKAAPAKAAKAAAAAAPEPKAKKART
jgi:hypothetical protein